MLELTTSLLRSLATPPTTATVTKTPSPPSTTSSPLGPGKKGVKTGYGYVSIHDDSFFTYCGMQVPTRIGQFAKSYIKASAVRAVKKGAEASDGATVGLTYNRIHKAVYFFVKPNSAKRVYRSGLYPNKEDACHDLDILLERIGGMSAADRSKVIEAAKNAYRGK